VRGADGLPFEEGDASGLKERAGVFFVSRERNSRDEGSKPESAIGRDASDWGPTGIAEGGRNGTGGAAALRSPGGDIRSDGCDEDDVSG
jgi:hypothetical protein